MRKHIRRMMRIAAEKKHMKPSRAVHDGWEARQVKKLGWTHRAINIAKGTAPKHKWGQRIRAMIG